MQTQDILRKLDSLVIVANSRLDDTTKARLTKDALPAIQAAIIILANDNTRNAKKNQTR
jgi:hypothetical protein